MKPSEVFDKGDEKDYALGAAPVQFKLIDGAPQGLIRSISLRYFLSAVSAGGASAVADGDLALIRSLTVKDDNHGYIYQDLDGKLIYRFMTLLLGRVPKRTTLTTSAMSVRIPLPFGNWGHLRHPAVRLNDLALWCQTATPRIEGSLGPITDILSGGSPTATVRMRPFFVSNPNPDPAPEIKGAQGNIAQAAAASGGDRPYWQPEVSAFDFTNLQVGKSEQNLLIGSGRKPLYVMLSERNSSTDAEVTDVVTADTTELSLLHGSDSIFNNVPLTDFDAWAEDFFNVTLPSGIHIIPLAMDGKVLDTLSLDPATTFKLRLSNIATASTRKIRVCQFNAVPVEPDAAPERQALKA